MASFPWTEIAIILALIALNGFFAGAELAIVSARKARLLLMERAGSKGAATALKLQADPGRFLSAVQIGITLVGIANGAFSGAKMAEPAGQLLQWLGVPASFATQAGFAAVIIIVTYLSLIIGELVPKQLALLHPEPFAARVAPVMAGLTKVAGLFVSLLDASTAAIFRLLRIDRDQTKLVTEEELRHMVEEAETAGVIEGQERELISGIMRMADRPVRGLMTPRPEVEWLDLNADEGAIRRTLQTTSHSRLVVSDGTVDKVAGVLQARDALAAIITGEPVDLAALMRAPPVVPDVADATAVLAALRESDVPLAIVVDEYGHFEGLVTPADLLAAIAGEFRSDMDDDDDRALVLRDDGSWLVAGYLNADELADRLGFTLDEERDYQTVAGLALAELEHIPATGETFEAHGYCFEVVDMDGRKIDKLLVSRLEEE